MSYAAPVSDYELLFDRVFEVDQMPGGGHAEATSETRTAVLREVGRLAQEILQPLQESGDKNPAYLDNGVVRTSPGFAEGYKAISDGGWVCVSAPEEFGGMGLPRYLQNAVNEMMNGACLSLALNPLMTQGQIEALAAHAEGWIKELYIPKLVSGKWTGTMNLTEPQAGSDVGALQTRAVPNGDGGYSITGQKIYISWGDSDLSENVCHLVLARLPDGAPGTKGISLFLVPKLIPNEDGNPGARNSLRVVSLERKMGLHGSPTAVMEYSGATGWMVGEPHSGMKAMFTMMNNARLGVGCEGVGVAEAAFCRAHAFAGERKQGKANIENPTGFIIDHADVRRMLMTMKAQTFAARAICSACAVATDMAEATGEEAWARRADLLTPLAKAYGTETGVEVATLGIQVHGGMGYMEETGASQLLRDVRVTSIYEGTNGIQAADLVGRKLSDGGEAARALLREIKAWTPEDERLGDCASALGKAVDRVGEVVDWMVSRSDMNDRLAGSVAFLRAFALVVGGYYHLKAAGADPETPARLALAQCFVGRLLPEHAGLCEESCQGCSSLYSVGPEELLCA